MSVWESLPKKQCTKFSNEKSSFFFPVNFLEKLHASTYDLYNYIYEVKKNPPPSARSPAAARRGRSERHSRAVRTRLYREKKNARHPSFMYDNSTVSARGGNCDQGWQNAYNSGLPFGGFFLILYMYLYIPCMQIFKKIDRKKNRTFFIWKFGALFLWQTVQVEHIDELNRVKLRKRKTAGTTERQFNFTWRTLNLPLLSPWRI